MKQGRRVMWAQILDVEKFEPRAGDFIKHPGDVRHLAAGNTSRSVLAQKNPADGLAPRPWTRSYQYQPAAPVRLTNGLDWGDL